MSTAPITAAVPTNPAPNAGASVPPERIEPTTTKAISPTRRLVSQMNSSDFLESERSEVLE